MTEHRAPYPFARETYVECDETGYHDVLTWRPGVFIEQSQYHERAVAHGMGEIILTEVARFKPGRYPERVFYTRQWITPEGKLFGKTGLRITTTSAFKRLCKGYGRPYDIELEP